MALAISRSSQITFSCTHFRWSFFRDWELLTRRLAMIVRACHKHGIYVTEHHSSHLTRNPLTPEEDLSNDSNSLVLHLVNASGTLEPAGDDVGHGDV